MHKHHKKYILAIVTFILSFYKPQIVWANHTIDAREAVSNLIDYVSPDGLIYESGDNGLDHRVEHMLDHVWDVSTGHSVTNSNRPVVTYVNNNIMLDNHEIDPIGFINKVYRRVCRVYGGIASILQSIRQSQSGVIGGLREHEINLHNQKYSTHIEDQDDNSYKVTISPAAARSTVVGFERISNRLLYTYVLILEINPDSYVVRPLSFYAE
ncbi:MAG: hypothetical protein ACYC2U_07680 [Candidatus Amoebophilus sp.]